MERRSTYFQFKAAIIWFLTAIGIAIVWRLPLYLNADHLIWSDEAANLLTVKHLIKFHEPYFFYHGMRYQGLTESLLSLFFVPFFGFSALSQKLSGSVVYLAFSLFAARFFFTYVKDRWLRFFCAAFLIFPTHHLFYASFMAYGGHLLNALLGFCMFYSIYFFHSHKRTAHWQYPLTICGVIAIGIYTYRHYLIFYPSLALMVLFFRGSQTPFSRKHIRNLLVIGLFALFFPWVNQAIGEWIQSRTSENLNQFMSFKYFHLNSWLQIKNKIEFTVMDLWPMFFSANVHETFRTLGKLLGIASISVVLFGVIATWRRNSDLWRLYRISMAHVAIVFITVVVTPYANTPMDIRYLMPIYAVTPFLVTAIFSLTQDTEMKPRYQLGIKSLVLFYVAFGMVNTVFYNNYLGIQTGLKTVRQANGLEELIQYLRNEKIKCLFMDYSDAYRISLITSEEIVASGVHLPRIRRYEVCAGNQSPRIIAFKNTHEELPMFLDFKPKHALKYQVRAKLEHYTILESTP